MTVVFAVTERNKAETLRSVDIWSSHHATQSSAGISLLAHQTPLRSTATADCRTKLRLRRLPDVHPRIRDRDESSASTKRSQRHGTSVRSLWQILIYSVRAYVVVANAFKLGRSVVSSVWLIIFLQAHHSHTAPPSLFPQLRRLGLVANERLLH
jgi:hypothetical protein